MPFAPTPGNPPGAAHTLAMATCDEPMLCALTPREQHEYDALPHETRRRDWLAGRCAAKRAVGERWGMTADRIELTSVADAAPQVSVRTQIGCWSPLPGRLTLSHRDGVAIAVAFGSTAAIGVDVERAGDVSPVEVRYFLSEDERMRRQDIDATVVWVLKEAAWKALGLTADRPLSSLQLVFRDGASELIAVRYGKGEIRAHAAVSHIDATRPLIAAVVQITPEAS